MDADAYEAFLREKDMEENPNNPLYELDRAVAETVASQYEDVDGEMLIKRLRERGY